jgi:surfeit locus 1 family protein
MCIRFGIWQLHRLEQRRARNATAHARLREMPMRITASLLDSTGLIFRRATVSGLYDDERTIIVAGRSLNGAPGVHIFTPVRIGGAAVLVNRGWMPSADAAHLDSAALRESSPENVAGVILDVPHDPRGAGPDTLNAFRRVWYRPDIVALRRQYPYPLANYVLQILPAPDAPDYPVRLQPPALTEGPHLGYVIQWFSFAIIGVTGWLILLFKSGAARRQ